MHICPRAPCAHVRPHHSLRLAVRLLFHTLIFVESLRLACADFTRHKAGMEATCSPYAVVTMTAVSAAEDPDIVLEQVLTDMRIDLQKLRRTFGEVRSMMVNCAWHDSSSCRSVRLPM